MSTFRFHFSGDINYSEESDLDVKTHEDETIWLKSELVIPKEHDIKNIATHAKMFVCGDVEIGHVVAKEALQRMEDSALNGSIELAEKEHSDLVSGKYEGGLKIWECTYDLVEHLTQTNLSFRQLKVLDLGCGAGILGIYAFINAANVTFQDYNKEVIEWVTIPNVLLNLEENDRNINECKFYSGDWDSFNQILPDTATFDVILTSETIYNPKNYHKLINLFLQRLKKDGIIYIAAKTCYFGVGGGTREFEKQLDSQPLRSKVCWKSTGGIQREILEIRKNQDSFI